MQLEELMRLPLVMLSYKATQRALALVLIVRQDEEAIYGFPASIINYAPVMIEPVAYKKAEWDCIELNKKLADTLLALVMKE